MFINSQINKLKKQMNNNILCGAGASGGYPQGGQRVGDGRARL